MQEYKLLFHFTNVRLDKFKNRHQQEKNKTVKITKIKYSYILCAKGLCLFIFKTCQINDVFKLFYIKLRNMLLNSIHSDQRIAINRDKWLNTTYKDYYLKTCIIRYIISIQMYLISKMLKSVCKQLFTNGLYVIEHQNLKMSLQITKCQSQKVKIDAICKIQENNNQSELFRINYDVIYLPDIKLIFLKIPDNQPVQQKIFALFLLFPGAKTGKPDRSENQSRFFPALLQIMLQQVLEHGRLNMQKQCNRQLYQNSDSDNIHHNQRQFNYNFHIWMEYLNLCWDTYQQIQTVRNLLNELSEIVHISLHTMQNKVIVISVTITILMVLRKIFKSHEKMNLKLIEHKTVVVTGASSGIGASYVKYFAEHGFDVIMTARRQKNMEEIKESLKHCNVKITVFPSDLQTDEGVNSLVKFVRDYNQPIGAFVSNAGIAYFPVDFTDSPREEYTKIINLHVNKTTDLIQKIGQLFKEQKSGVFVQVASGLAS
ncbi:Very-long-chain_3-oxoacyl-CoA reductase / 17beta-estradiol 17-dehydrogenase [Hexamita inflata]|uniref:Very-long-chain_3-oxoacyl-CoA reductase / 17beta-estradiol 17-dehydrogenase n=1 Tax=Hexamita inflata TaxID=28002 RepID=A0ABP1JHX3_9EUKA